MDSNWF